MPRHSDSRVDDVLEFWFGDGSPAAMQRWFKKDPAFDAQIRERFGTLHADAAAGKLESWRGSAAGELALIVLLDQMSRNLFRDDARAFATDPQALAIARELFASGRRSELSLPEQGVAAMPFMHAEDRDTQRESVRLFEELAARQPENPMAKGGLDYAKQHAAIVERFGRYPHRNAVLGRESTAEEEAFLKQPGSSF